MFKWISKDQIKELNQIEIYKNLKNIDIQIGWFDSIKNMGIEIENYCKKNNLEIPNIYQIKTKFGGLRFYYKTNNNELNNIIEKWNIKINNTCEYCGLQDNVRTIIRNKVVLTLCEKEIIETDIDYNEFMKIQWSE